MTPETIFSVANIYVIPFWVLLAVAPGWKGTQALVHTFMLPILLAAVYSYMIVTGFGDAEGGNFNSLEGVAALFESPHALTAGWIHYLVFDLFVGAWIVRDSRRLKINHFLVIPCLFFTLMAGPVGLALYMILRIALKKSFTLDERVTAPTTA